MDKSEAKKVRQHVKRCLDIEGNNECADCAETISVETGWASISFGVTLCVKCAGVHRSIDGNQIRSFSLDSSAWSTTSNVEFFRKIGGNTKANNNVWEHVLPTFYINPKYDKFSCEKNENKLRKLFISNKYEKQLFTPESKQTQKTHSKQHLHIKKMPIDVRQNLLHFYDKETKLFAKKPDYCVIHGQYISRYSSSKIKKNKCTDIETYDLLKLKVVIDDRISTPANHGLDENEFIFMLYEDNTYIPANVYKMGGGNMKKINIRRKENEIIRIKFIGDFNTFIKIIHDIRATINYHRLYEQLVNMGRQQDEPLIIMNYDLQQANFLGIGKVFNSTKCYFFVINDTLYGLATKKDPRTLFDAADKCAHLNAKYGWSLNKINIALDDNGKRTGSKYALLLILRNKTIGIKYDNGPAAVQFYTNLQKLCIATKGRYLVNFTSTPPTICGDETDNKKDESVEKDDQQPEMKEKMQLLRKKSHHQKCPTQILEIISQIQIDEEINGPVIYEDIEESEHEEYVYEIAQQQNSTELMSLPPAPGLLNQNSDDFKLNVNVKQQQSPPNPMAAGGPPPNPMAGQGVPPPNPMQSGPPANPMQANRPPGMNMNAMLKNNKNKNKKKKQSGPPPPNPMQAQAQPGPPPNPMQPPGPPPMNVNPMQNQPGPPGPPPMNANPLNQPPGPPGPPGPPPMNNMNANPLNMNANPLNQGPPGPPGPPPMNTNPLNAQPQPIMNVSYGGGIKERLRLEQEKKKKEYEAERLRIEKEKLEKEREERAALELQRQKAEEERLRITAELEETKAKMAAEAAKRKELEEEARRLREQQNKKSNALAPNMIQPHMQVVDKGGAIIGSPKSWEQLEQKMKDKHRIEQGLSVEEALAAKFNNQNDESSSSDESSESDYSTDSDYSKRNSTVVNNNRQPPPNAQQGYPQQQQPPQNNVNMYGQQGYGYGQYNQQQQQQQQQGYGHQKQQGSQVQNNGMNAYGQPANNAMNQYGHQKQQGSQAQKNAMNAYGQPQYNQYAQQQQQQQQNKGSFNYGQQPNPNERGSFNNYGQPQVQQQQQQQQNMNAMNGSFSQNDRGSFNNYGQPQPQVQQQPSAQPQPQQNNYANNNLGHPSLNNNVSSNKSNKSTDRWQCPMCTFENKPTAMICDMCTVERPKPKGNGNDKMSVGDLKKLHKEMTYHYNEYTKMQQLPPKKQQEMHQQMTYHYQQYSIKYKQYQQNQNKPKVVKARKSKLVSGNQMQYLKLQRIFSMNQQQQAILLNPQHFNTIRQLFGPYAQITVVPQNNCYQIAIPNNIALPRRKDHWQQILQIITSQIGISQEI